MTIKIKLNDNVYKLNGDTFARFEHSLANAFFAAKTKEEAKMLGYVLFRWQHKWYDEDGSFGAEDIDAWADEDELLEDIERWLFYAKQSLVEQEAKHE